MLFLQIERERNKERLENKRRQDQLKKVFDEEKEENKKKLLEVINTFIYFYIYTLLNEMLYTYKYIFRIIIIEKFAIILSFF